MAKSLRASGVRTGMKVHNAYGYGLFTGGPGAHYGAEALGATVIFVSGGHTEKQVQLILGFEPDAIMCTPRTCCPSRTPWPIAASTRAPPR